MGTPGDFFLTIDRFGDAIALVADGRQVSYRELTALADEYAAWIGQERTLVFLEADNDLPSIAAYLGALRANHVVFLFGEGQAGWLGQLADEYRPGVILRHDRGQLVAERRKPGLNAKLHPDLGVLLSTSGSTGSPKLVKLSKANLCANSASICRYLELTAQDRAVCSLKLHYSYGLSVLHTHLAVGGGLVLTNASVVTDRFWDLFVEHKATSFAGVPYTFDLLANDDGWFRTPGLRYVTQAGGRLHPDKVRNLALAGQEHGWQFVVMYGQTEASPRMAWLPPHLAAENPDCIGLPLPGGELALLGPDGIEIAESGRQGELIYRGPNVMMGYAQSAADLETDKTPAFLRTGDIGERTALGLFRIVGRAARIVKPFGIRIDLDEFQELVRTDVPDAVCTGTDEQIVIATTASLSAHQRNRLPEKLARLCKVPVHIIIVKAVTQIPLLPNQKPDYRAILGLVEAHVGSASRRPTLREQLTVTAELMVSARLYRRALVEAKGTFGMGAGASRDVRSIFAQMANASSVDGSETFQSLSGDSLTYVQTSLALEEYLGFLPEGWESMPVDDLEGARVRENLV